MTAKNKNAILVLDWFHIFDATRTAFFTELAKATDNLFIINTQLHTENQIQTAIKSLLKDYKVVLALWVNDLGVSPSVADLFSQKGIPTVLWYWDLPSKTIPKADKVFYAVHDYTCTPGLKQKGEPLYFAGIPPYPVNDNPTKNIMFLGTCWDIKLVMDKISLGLINVEDGQWHDLQSINQKIDEDQFMQQKWRFINQMDVDVFTVLNAYSSIKRCQNLQAVADLGLDIYGDYHWVFNTAAIAPDLASKHIPHLVNSQDEMNQVMRDYKISLNIFHLQNKNGGPNFRILDSVVHNVPILSDFNAHCEKIFPHNEAALYFKNVSELRDYAQLLINDSGLRKKLITRAREILQSEHLLSHRVKTLCDHAAVKSSFQHQAQIYQLTEDDFHICNLAGTNNIKTPIKKDITQSFLYQSEKKRFYYLEMLRKISIAVERLPKPIKKSLAKAKAILTKV